MTDTMVHVVVEACASRGAGKSWFMGGLSGKRHAGDLAEAGRVMDPQAEAGG
jgi:hypothetical protein